MSTTYNITEQLNTLAGLNLSNLDKPLMNTLNTLGLNYEHLSPDNMSSGLRIWQNVNEFAEMLMYLHNYPGRFSSYLEIGVRWGGSFITVSEILKKYGEVKLYANDIIPMSDILRSYKTVQDFQYIECDSRHILEHVGCDVDLIFIDGSDSYDDMVHDYRCALEFNPKVIIFHDIRSIVFNSGYIKDHEINSSELAWRYIKTNHSNTKEIDCISTSIQRLLLGSEKLPVTYMSGGYGIITL
jgi:hypothetical protein